MNAILPPLHTVLVLFSAYVLDSTAANGLVGPGAMQPFGGGGRPRAQRYGYVREPAKAFYVGGSKIDEMNA